MARETFGERIGQYRRELAARLRKDVWPADVARHMGITRSAYSHWEKGRTRPRDIGVYQKLANFLGVTLRDLGVRISEMAPEPERGQSGLPLEEGMEQPVLKPSRKKKQNRG